MHHMHLIVITERICDICPLRARRRRFPVEGRLEADDTGVQLGRDPYLTAKAPLELADPQPCAVCKIGHSNTSIAREHICCCVRYAADAIVAGEVCAQVSVRNTRTVDERGHVSQSAQEAKICASTIRGFGIRKVAF